MKVLATSLALLLISATAVSCTGLGGFSSGGGPQTKVRIQNTRLINSSQSMVILFGEAWNDDTVPLAVKVTGSLMDANGKILVSGDQTLPVIQPGTGVPFNIPFPPNDNAVKQSVTVKSADTVENK